MSKKIFRTFYTVTAKGIRMNSELEFEEFTYRLDSRFTPRTATVRLRNKLNDPTIIINEVIDTPEYYYITEDEFKKYGHKREEEQHD